MTSWHLRPIFDSYPLVLLLGGLLVLGLWIRPAFEGVTPRRNRILSIVRGAVIFMVIFGMLRPTRVHTMSRTEPSQLILLLDTSRSMQVTDAASGLSRWEILRDAVESSIPLLRDMERHWKVEIYTFDSSIEPRPLLEHGESLPAIPTGDESDLAGSLQAALRRASGQRLGAVLLFSDGAHRVLQPKVDLHRPAAELARRQCPLYAVSIGAGRDTAQSRDIAVSNFQDHYSVFVKNELHLRGLVRVQGYVNQNIPAELVVTDGSGTSRIVDAEILKASRDGQSLSVDFRYTPQDSGQYKLTVRVPEQPGEIVEENNELSAFLNVLDGGLRVLYLDGKSFWSEAKFVRWVIDSSPDMELDFQWVQSRLRKNNKWRIDVGELLAQEDYDVVILRDIDQAALGDEGCQQLTEAIEQGMGLLMSGGFHSFGPGGYYQTALAAALPIQIGRFERQDFDDPIREDMHLRRELQMVPTQSHFITHLAPGEENAAVWNSLPTLLGANRFTEIKERQARVLAESQDGQPLLVEGQYGLGRTLAFAADSTFRWHRRGYEAQHRRFWRQAILWLAHKEDTLRDDVWVKLDQRRLRPGVSVGFDVGVRNADGDPIRDASLSAKLIAPDGTSRALPLGQEAEQWTGSLSDVTEPGDYLIEVVATSIGTGRAQFMVVDEDLELADPAANPQQMEMLAGLTSEVGGRVVSPEEVPNLLDQLENQPVATVIQQRSKWQLADTAWDASGYFVVLVSLLASEWFLRKKWGMV